MRYHRLNIDFLLIGLTLLSTSFPLAAQPSDPQARLRQPVLTQTPPELEAVVVRATPDGAAVFLPAVQGAEIYAGKKTTRLTPAETQAGLTNNFRLALNQTPGLLLSEETTPLLSIGGRGFDPHRAQFFQVLKDGLPIHADPFGYPEAYYTPPLAAVQAIELVRGGGSLLYGPQPAGTINFVTYVPRTDKSFHFTTENTFGSYGLFTNYTAVDGTVDRVGYLAYFNHRQADGFRATNSDYQLDTGSAKIVLALSPASRLIFNVDATDEEHGEPGGLAPDSAPATPNTRFYSRDRNATTRTFDRFRLERYAAYAKYQHDLDAATLLEIATWGGYYKRYSKRQRGGGFGTIPTGPTSGTNAIENQEFYNFGFEPRVRRDYDAFGNSHTLTAGFQTYYSTSPRRDERGATPFADSGSLRRKTTRATTYVAFFAENRFQFGKLAIVPAIRLENYWTSVQETTNVDKTGSGLPLTDRTKHEFVPLPGIGLEYELFQGQAVYANVSKAYQPNFFTDGFSPAANAVSDPNIKPGDVWQYEVGWRGQPVPWAYWDTSLFLVDFGNRVGSIPNGAGPGLTLITNTGRSRTIGWDTAAGLDLIGLADALAGTRHGETWGKLRLQAALTLQNGKFVSGRQDGNNTQYTPNILLRTGVVYEHDRGSLSLLNTLSGPFYADDANTRQREVPAYNTWDLVANVRVYRDIVSLTFGVNNLLDEDYFSRVRNDGIDPAARRNYYGAVRVAF